jgi:putative hydrolase of the HAD superfamily
MPQAVLFDLDDTLTDRRATLLRYAARLRADFDADLHSVDAQTIFELMHATDGRGYASRKLFFQTLQQQLSWRRTPDLRQFIAHWEEWFPADTEPRAGMLEALEELRAAGFRLGILTNGRVQLQEPKIDRLGIRSWFTAVVVSEAFGVHKPDPRVFAHAAQQLACAAQDVWYVGDHPHNDVTGASGAGLRPIWLSGIHPWPEELPPPRHQIESLGEVLAAIRRHGK